MTSATTFKLADPAAPEPLPWVGIPPLSMQQLWFALQRLEWATLAVVPADGKSSAVDFGRPLYEVGRLAMGEKLRLLDARDVKLNRTAPMILDMTGANPASANGGTQWSERVLVMVESVLTQPSAVPLVLASDAALLCLELGKTSLAAAEETLQLLGKQRFVGCVLLPAR